MRVGFETRNGTRIAIDLGPELTPRAIVGAAMRAFERIPQLIAARRQAKKGKPK